MSSDKIVCSPYASGASFSQGINLPSLLWRRIEQFTHWKDSTAIICGQTGSSYTFGDVQERSKAFASASKNVLGLGKQDRVMLILPNCIEYPIIVLGLLEAGCVVSALNPGYKHEVRLIQMIAMQLKDNLFVTNMSVPYELDHIFRIVSPTCIILCKDRLPDIPAMKDNMGCLPKLILMDGESQCAYSYQELLRFGYNNLMNNDDPAYFEDDFDMEDTALILYSSGTTGLPKAVMLSHLNFCSGLIHLAKMGEHHVVDEFVEGGKQERLIVPLPLFHIFGLHICMFYSMYQGAQVVILPNFEHDLLITCTRKYKPTIWQIVPPMLKAFVNCSNFVPEDFSLVKSIKCGAAPLGETLENEFALKFPGVIIIQDFGLTESTAAIISCSLVNPKFNKPGSIGALFPGALGKVIDTSTGISLGPYKPGELLLKGNQIMKGYMNNEEATKNTIDKEGWLHTGDIAEYDEDGCFYIVDRLKEIINYKGFQVSPSELENVLRKMPLVLDVAVVGVKSNDDCDELPKAFVVRKDNSLTELAVVEYLQDRVIDYKRLRGGVQFVEKIPVSAAGKIMRRNLTPKINIGK